MAAELARLFVGPRLLTVAFDHMRMRVEKPAVVQARVWAPPGNLRTPFEIPVGFQGPWRKC